MDVSEKHIQSICREKWIDNAKGIAMLLVILGHIGGWIQEITKTDLNFIHGVDLLVFFLISGYTTKKKALNLEYLKKRSYRLIVPYLWTCLAVIIIDLLNRIIFWGDASFESLYGIIVKDLTRSLFSSGANTRFGPIEIAGRIGAIWFLPALFFAGLLFQLLLSATDSEWGTGLLSAIVTIAGMLTARLIWLPFSIQSGMFAVFYLWIGYETRMHHLLEKTRWFHYAGALFILILGIHMGYCNLSFVTASAKNLILSTLTGLAGSLLIFGLAKADQHGIILEWIGKRSLWILCFHLISMETLGPLYNAVLKRLGFHDTSFSILYFVLELAFALGMPFLIEKVFQKTIKRNRSRT